MEKTTKIQQKGRVTIPTSIRGQAGLSRGDLVEFSFRRGQIVITPKAAIDQSKFHNADGEYTLEQRRSIDAGIRQGVTDFKKGRFHGPFNAAEEVSAHVERLAMERPNRDSKHPR